MADRHRILILLLLLVAAALCAAGCERPAPETPKQTAPAVILKPRPKLLTPEQRAQLDFPPEVIAHVEKAAAAAAEPFFEEVMLRSSNLKGDVMIAAGRLSGFSVHVRNADQMIADLAGPLRAQGFLLFRSEQNVGAVPDIVTVVRGRNSYDILKIQKTEAPHYQIDTAAIIRWLKAQQKRASFVITGAGADWLEGRFIRQPKNMPAFASAVAGFAPDVLREGHRSEEHLAEWMAETNGFRLVWE
jgi:hypothetical protein